LYWFSVNMTARFEINATPGGFTAGTPPYRPVDRTRVLKRVKGKAR
jgi:hypothetical protein